MIYIGASIKQIRLRAKMTQSDFANAIGCDQATLSRYESCLTNPSIQVLMQIIKVAKSKKIKIKLEDIFPDE